MADAGTRRGEALDLGIVELDAVRMPDVGAGPADALGVVAGPAAEALEAVRDVVIVLGQMRVQADAVAARQRRGSRISSRDTENGEQGATAMRVIAKRAGS